MLGQVVLKLTAPGIPDLYQGDELPFRALVDPDNRRPVDWGWYQAMLARLMGGSPPARETRKLFLILRLLTLRTRRPEAFATGAYEPVEAGERACAFSRGGEVLVAVATRDGAADREFARAPGPLARRPAWRAADVQRPPAARRRARRARDRRAGAAGALGPNAVSAHRGATGPCAAR